MMKMLRMLLVLGLPIAMLAGCGSDDDDNGSSGRVDQETTDPNCLTVEQRANITNFLNRAANLRTFTGTASGDWRNDNGTVVSSRDFQGSYNFTQTNDNTWEIRQEFCEGGDDCSYNVTNTAAFENGCFTWDGERAVIDDNTSANMLDFDVTRAGVEFDFDWSLPESGPARFETNTEVAGQDLDWTFISTETGGTTGDAGTTGGATTGDAGTTTGETGTTGGTTGDAGTTTGETGTTTGGTTTGTTAGFGF